MIEGLLWQFLYGLKTNKAVRGNLTRLHKTSEVLLGERLFHQGKTTCEAVHDHLQFCVDDDIRNLQRPPAFNEISWINK